MTRTLIILATLFVTFYYATAQGAVRASFAWSGGGWYNITVTGSSSEGTLLVKIINVDEKGVVLFQTAYDDAVEYYDGHMTSLITREGFSFKFDSAFGCFRRCVSTSLVRASPPLLATLEFPTCGGIC